MKGSRIALILLVISNALSISVAFYFYVIASHDSELQSEKIFHLEEKVSQLRNYVLQQNSNLGFEEFRKKHGINEALSEYEHHTGNVKYSDIYFIFKDGRLVEVE